MKNDKKKVCKLNNKHKPSPLLKPNKSDIVYLDKVNALNIFFTNISIIDVSLNLVHNLQDHHWYK